MPLRFDSLTDLSGVSKCDNHHNALTLCMYSIIAFVDRYGRMGERTREIRRCLLTAISALGRAVQLTPLDDDGPQGLDKRKDRVDLRLIKGGKVSDDSPEEDE